MTTVTNERCKATRPFRDREDRGAGNKRDSCGWRTYDLAGHDGRVLTRRR